MSEKLSPTMVDAYDYAVDHGRIVRYPGGFWAREGWPGRRTEKWFGTTTIQALVSRGVFSYSEWKASGKGRFPVAVEVTPQPEPDHER